MYICCSCIVFITFSVVHMFIYVLKLFMIGGNKEYLSIYLYFYAKTFCLYKPVDSYLYNKLVSNGLIGESKDEP